LNDPAALDVLSGRLKDEHWEIRQAAVEALAGLGSERALSALKSLKNDPRPEVREAAKEAGED
jgi:HEAT repeat protein